MLEPGVKNLATSRISEGATAGSKWQTTKNLCVKHIKILLPNVVWQYVPNGYFL